MWWYDLIDDGKVRDEQEHHFGLLNVDLSPKPAYSTLKAITPYLRDFNYVPSESLQADSVYKLVFSNGRERIMVAWATGRPREDRITATALNNTPLRMLDTQVPDKGMLDSGQRWTCTGDQCAVPVTLTEFPKIYRLNPGA
jgi:hypothetical protein